jgi:hypothetical protein
MLARNLVTRALDWNRDGNLDIRERSGARIVLYGQSLGGDAAIHLARELNAMDVPVLLTVQVDSVGLHDASIPPNVGAAANFYQHELFTIQGQRHIHADDPTRTNIVANLRFSYRNRKIDASAESWLRRTFGGAHARMELDPEVWRRVEGLILGAITADE